MKAEQEPIIALKAEESGNPSEASSLLKDYTESFFHLSLRGSSQAMGSMRRRRRT